MFDGFTIPDARPIVWMKRSFVAVIAALLVIGALASYRAYFQVRSLDLEAPQTLTGGIGRGSCGCGFRTHSSRR